MNFPKMKYAVLPLAAMGAAACGDRAAERPNIIVIMTDDHTVQAMSCYGSQLMETPNLDRLAREGMLMNNCFVSNAISGPSRACILTGKYSHINGFTDNSQRFDGDQQTFPKLLHEAGYQTAMIGKWHLNSDPQGFDRWSILVGQGEYYSPQFIENGERTVCPGYVTDIITDKAIEYLDGRDPDRPFAMLWYHKAPHRNWMPAQRHLGIYDDHVFPEPPNLLDDYSGRGSAARGQEMEIGRDMRPEWDLKLIPLSELESVGELEITDDANKDDVRRANDRAASLKQYKAACARMTDEERARWDEAYAPRIDEWRRLSGRMSPSELVKWKYQQYMKDYCAVIKAFDESVGRLTDYLEKEGLLDNTVIIYTSDQGFYLGEHGWFDKRFMYEESQRTPLLIRYPKRIKAGTQSDALAMNLDLAPTILELAGLDVPSDIQGRSLVGLFDSDGAAPDHWRTGVYYHYYEYPSWHSVKRHYGVRTDRYKLIHFYNDTDEWELYDLAEDPSEMRNVYDDPSYADIRRQMHDELERLRTECGDDDPCETRFEFFKGADLL